MLTALVSALAGTVPPMAGAALVYSRTHETLDYLQLRYDGQGREENELSVFREIADGSAPDSEATAINFLELGLVTIHPTDVPGTGGCEPGFGSSEHNFAARCPVPSLTPDKRYPSILVELGAGDDRITAFTTDLIVTATGGAGRDVLRSGDAHDVLVGDEGEDALRGGGGSDSLIGGDGNDNMIDLEAGEERLPQNFFRGDLGSDTIQDGDGNSIIHGDVPRHDDEGDRDEGDRIYDEGGRDEIYSGAGQDVIRARDGEKERVIHCGAGRGDRAIVDLADLDVTRSSCEIPIRPHG